MCVIINREANIEIPFDKIRSACHVNPHGFGLMFAEDGKLNIIREFSDKGNDPEKVARLLEDYKAHRLSLHLRYQTVGDKSLDNCHPYIVATQEQDQVDLAFMHNGTLSEFKRQDSTMSDSYHFGQELIRPLFERFAAFDSPETVLWDPLFHAILSKYCGGLSVFNLMDSEGNILVINEERGKKFDGWWASNDYSFNSFHREPIKDTTKGGNWYYNGQYYSREYTYPKDDDIQDIGKDTTVKNLPAKIVKEVPEVSPPTPRESFIEVANLTALEEVCKLNDEDIEELIEVYPEYAKLLIQDLILQLYQKESDVATSYNLAANG